MTRWGICLACCCILAIPGIAGDSFPGYTLFAPISLTSTFLVDLAGQVVHEWKSDAPAGNAVYLLPNGHLLRTEAVAPPQGERQFDRGGAGGRVREIAPDGHVVWEFVLSTAERRLHHDVEPLPNGNVLVIAWEAKTRAQALSAGRDPRLLPDGELWPDSLLEVRPIYPTGGEIVWEWHVWDHLVQDRDPRKPDYGVVAEHPERIDVNYPAAGGSADWNHTNSVAYNPLTDQILVSVREWNEIWVIDHSTTSAEAAGTEGGRGGRGGDLLGRMGNPAAYGCGSSQDQTLFAQHDAQWIASGCPGEGNILVFNNGGGDSAASESSVDEIALSLVLGTSSDGCPSTIGELVWRYTAPGFLSQHISGAQRLPNGNTLICEGDDGRLFEVDAAGGLMWEFVNPFATTGPRGIRNEVFKARRYAPEDPGVVSLLAAIGTP
ncbi:MAG: aryl-sulfate sulfotransferase [Candidatus Bipolaricaulota bacterium]